MPGPVVHQNAQGQPQEVYGVCAVALENGNILILGGIASQYYPSSKKVILFNPTTNETTTQEDMNEKREYCGCTEFKSAKHGKYIPDWIKMHDKV